MLHTGNLFCGNMEDLERAGEESYHLVVFGVLETNTQIHLLNTRDSFQQDLDKLEFFLTKKNALPPPPPPPPPQHTQTMRDPCSVGTLEMWLCAYYNYDKVNSYIKLFMR